MKNMAKGIFWVICDFDETESNIEVNLNDFSVLYFAMPCDINGVVGTQDAAMSNSKKGDSFNHKITWESGLFGSREFIRLTQKSPYNYFPRGRVEIANAKCKIFLNGSISTPDVINEIKRTFGLSQDLESIKVIVDNSQHYSCYADGLDFNSY